MNASDRLPFAAALISAWGQMPSSATNIVVGVYLAPHYAGEVGFSLAVVRFSFFLVRAIDIPIDLFLGLAMGGTPTPLGRYRVWLLTGVSVLMLSVYMLFIAEPPASQGYRVGWLLLLYLGTLILTLAQAS